MIEMLNILTLPWTGYKKLVINPGHIEDPVSMTALTHGYRIQRRQPSNSKYCPRSVVQSLYSMIPSILFAPKVWPIKHWFVIRKDRAFGQDFKTFDCSTVLWGNIHYISSRAISIFYAKIFKNISRYYYFLQHILHEYVGMVLVNHYVHF